MTLQEKATMVVGYLYAIRKEKSSGFGAELNFDYPGLGFASPFAESTNDALFRISSYDLQLTGN